METQVFPLKVSIVKHFLHKGNQSAGHGGKTEGDLHTTQHLQSSQKQNLDHFSHSGVNHQEIKQLPLLPLSLLLHRRLSTVHLQKLRIKI